MNLFVIVYALMILLITIALVYNHKLEERIENIVEDIERINNRIDVCKDTIEVVSRRLNDDGK